MATAAVVRFREAWVDCMDSGSDSTLEANLFPSKQTHPLNWPSAKDHCVTLVV